MVLTFINIHERFLTYPCILVYLGSGVDPISSKLPLYSFIFISILAILIILAIFLVLNTMLRLYIHALSYFIATRAISA
jgi:hypothetical protein